jgi:hypothetical protein
VQPRDTAPAALDNVKACFDTLRQVKTGKGSGAGGGSPLSGRVLHVIGNHCLYSLDRHQIISALGMAAEAPPDEEGCLYYSVSLAAGVRLVVLDGYDISYSWPAGTRRGDLARKMLAAGRGASPDDNISTAFAVAKSRRACVWQIVSVYVCDSVRVHVSDHCIHVCVFVG